MTSGTTSRRLGLRAGQKLGTAAEFERARKSRERHTDAFFIVQCADNALGRARLGMAVGARAIGNAVGRNRLRRLIRESFRVNRPTLPPLDLFVTARAAARAAGNREIAASLDRLWQDIRAAR
ncbi:MAG: ribonuclease P protein component [Steroidobacteraceae bacterium]|nr:ribonuclease P protein component [Steroidobacteraceae bacterium]